MLGFNSTSYSETKNPLKEIESAINSTFKTLSGKSLNKKETKDFILNNAITLEDERGEGVVTYVFNEKEYFRYKEYKKISTDGWRFTNIGKLRLFDGDLKISWRIKLGKKGKKDVINIKAKFDPIGKIYEFSYIPKSQYFEKLNQLEKKAKEEKERLEQEKLEAQKKAEEEKERLEQEKLEAQKKAEEEKIKLEKEIEEQKKKLEEEKAKLEKEIEEQKKKLKEEKLYNELEPKYRRECEKKLFNDLYEIGSPEYRACIINKGIDKQLEQENLKNQTEIEKKAKEEKERLEQEKLEAQNKNEDKKQSFNKKGFNIKKHEFFDEFREKKYFQYFGEKVFPNIPLDFPYNDISARLVLVCGYSKTPYFKFLFNKIPGLDIDKAEFQENSEKFLYRLKSRWSFGEKINTKAKENGIDLSEGIVLYATHKMLDKSLYGGVEVEMINEVSYFFHNLEGDKSKDKIILMVVMPHIYRNNTLYKFNVTNFNEAIKDCQKYYDNN